MEDRGQQTQQRVAESKLVFEREGGREREGEGEGGNLLSAAISPTPYRNRERVEREGGGATEMG